MRSHLELSGAHSADAVGGVSARGSHAKTHTPRGANPNLLILLITIRTKHRSTKQRNKTEYGPSLRGAAMLWRMSLPVSALDLFCAPATAMPPAPKQLRPHDPHDPKGFMKSATRVFPTHETG